jgi:pimeloyl-ACP methyl ester carboxylesterase
VEEYADFVKSKISGLRTLGSELTVLGHSFGGQVAAYFTAHNPEMVDKLILFAPALFRRRRGLRRLLFGFAAKCGKLIFKLPFIEKFDVLAKKILYKSADSPDYNETSGIKREIFKKIIRQDMTVELSKITVPTLLIQGTLDKYVPLKDAKRAIKLIQDAKLEIINLGRHGMHFQQPENLLKIIKQFLDDNSA